MSPAQDWPTQNSEGVTGCPPCTLQSAGTASGALRSLDKRQGRKQRAMSQESFSSGLGWILIFYMALGKIIFLFGPLFFSNEIRGLD